MPALSLAMPAEQAPDPAQAEDPVAEGAQAVDLVAVVGVVDSVQLTGEIA